MGTDSALARYHAGPVRFVDHPKAETTTNQPARSELFDSPAVAMFRPPAPERNVAHWRINGHPAIILIWTAEEWERMEEHPADAQYYPCGVWCALRLV
jgi:hypothetical protein